MDSGQATNTPPRAIGLTFISFSYLMVHYQSKPIMVSLTNLRHLPAPLWQAVLEVTTTPPVADFLDIGCLISPNASLARDGNELIDFINNRLNVTSR